MPFIHICISGPALPPARVRRLQGAATRLMADVLGKNPDLTAVRVESVDPDDWSVAGAPVVAAAHLDAKITAGTNTPEQKADFIAQAHGLLAEAVGPGLSAATYVVIHEVAADAWGYAGRTQASRRSDPV